MAPEQQETVARRAHASASASVSAAPWRRLQARIVAVGGVATLDAMRETPEGELVRVEDIGFFGDWLDLKEAMADEHGAWFSSDLTIESDGSYGFDFNDDRREPTAWVTPPLDDAVWTEEIKHFPRPWSEIPSWHPVRRDFTEESWAAEVAGA